MNPKARRVVRSIKYFFVFIILAGVVLCLVTLLSGESVAKLFLPYSQGGMLKEGAWWQMLLIFGAIAAVYPGLTFVRKEVMIEGDFEDHRNTIINAFESLGYEKTDEDGEKLTFRLRNHFTRFMRAYEDGVTITKPHHLRPARGPGRQHRTEARRPLRFRKQQQYLRRPA